MSPIVFEARRTLRDVPLLVLWLGLAGLGVAQAVASGGELPATLILAPFLAIYVAASDTAAGLRSGRFDFLLSRGPDLQHWCLVRLALAVAVGVTTAGLPLLFSSGPAHGSWAREALGWLGVVLYWSALGLLLGLRVSGAAAVAFMLAMNVAVLWWLLAGAALILGTVALPPFWGWVNKTLLLLVLPEPAVQGGKLLPSLGSTGALLRGLLAAMLVVVTLWRAARREMPVREEG